MSHSHSHQVTLTHYYCNWDLGLYHWNKIQDQNRASASKEQHQCQRKSQAGNVVHLTVSVTQNIATWNTLLSNLYALLSVHLNSFWSCIMKMKHPIYLNSSVSVMFFHFVFFVIIVPIFLVYFIQSYYPMSQSLLSPIFKSIYFP